MRRCSLDCSGYSRLGLRQLTFAHSPQSEAVEGEEPDGTAHGSQDAAPAPFFEAAAHHQGNEANASLRAYEDYKVME
jgi:hypothetical protein